MIVVNKADSADLPKGGFDDDDIDSDHALVHSVEPVRAGHLLRLVDSRFGREEFRRIHKRQLRREIRGSAAQIRGSSSRFYKTLYRYDILPGQIGRRADRESETCKDLLLANSGLFCIENEIRLFAERYSAYNKCSNRNPCCRKSSTSPNRRLTARRR